MSLAPAEYNVASYLVVGILVVIFNLPLCCIILSDPQMRIIFGVLGALFTAGFLTGVGSILKALSRIFEYDSDLMDEYIFSGFRCLYKPYVLMDLFTFPSFSVLLMLNSFDRLVVISVPITYFKKSKTIVICEILFGLILISVLETYTIAMAVVDDDHDASIFCRQLDFLPVYVYKVNITFRLLCSVLAILLMLIVVYKLRQRSSNSKKLQQNPYEQAETSGLQAYMSKQNDFTKAMLISCAFTFLLDTIPNVIVVCAHSAKFPNYDDYVTYTRIISMLNSIIMATVVLCRKTDIRTRFLAFLKAVFSRKKAIGTISRGGWMLKR